MSWYRCLLFDEQVLSFTTITRVICLCLALGIWTLCLRNNASRLVVQKQTGLIMSCCFYRSKKVSWMFFSVQKVRCDDGTFPLIIMLAFCRLRFLFAHRTPISASTSCCIVLASAQYISTHIVDIAPTSAGTCLVVPDQLVSLTMIRLFNNSFGYWRA